LERASIVTRFVNHPGVMNMAKKRTKADKAQRQADELESKLERRPEQVPEKTVTPARTSAQPPPRA
jgi:hypothetical protein